MLVVPLTSLLQHSHNNIIFTISNDGSPISPQAEARLFERFYKVSKHDNSNGLGSRNYSVHH